jgi:hypothetical protein
VTTAVSALRSDKRDVVHRSQDRGHVLAAIRRDTGDDDRAARRVGFVGDPMIIDEQLTSDVARLRATGRTMFTSSPSRRATDEDSAASPHPASRWCPHRRGRAWRRTTRAIASATSGPADPATRSKRRGGGRQRQRGRRRVRRVDEAWRRRATALPVYVSEDLTPQQAIVEGRRGGGLFDL